MALLAAIPAVTVSHEMVVGTGVDVSRDLTDVATRRPSSDFLGLSTNSTASSPGIHNFIAQLRAQPESAERDEELRSAVARAWAERASLPSSSSASALRTA